MDDILRQLRRAPPAGALDEIDDIVMTAVAELRRDAIGVKRLTTLAAFVSLSSGAFAGVIMGEPVGSPRPLSPFASVNALAPSALLDAQ